MKMLTFLRPLGILLLLSLPLHSMAQKKGGGDKDKAGLQKMFMEYLKTEGFRPEVDSDGDVQFKVEGKTYFIEVLVDDPTFFRLVLANIWPIESEEERGQVLVAVDFSNAKVKVTKSFIVKENVWVSIEMFLPKAEDFKAVFARSLDALNNGVDNFATKMRELQGN